MPFQIAEVAPPAAIAAPAPFDRSKLNLFVLIGHGPPSEMTRLSVDAVAAGFHAGRPKGPEGEEVMVVFDGAHQEQAWTFVQEAEAGRHGHLRFERGYLPPAPR